MPDKIKVFTNAVDQVGTTSLAAIPITVLTTNSTTQAVVKDVQIQVKHPTLAFDGIYKYPIKVKLNGFTVAEDTAGASLRFEGSQIVDTSSTLNVEIQAETQKVDYGTFEAVLPAGNGMKYYKFTLASLSDPTSPSVILAKMSDTGTMIKTSTENHPQGVKIVRPGNVTNFAYAKQDGTGFVVWDTAGAIVTTVNWPATSVYHITADATYIYGKEDAANGRIFRFLISDFSNAGNLAGGNFNMRYTNPGFFLHYNGFLYARPAGNDTTVYKVNTTTGAESTFSVPNANSEALGACITVNTSGVAYLVIQSDTYTNVWNLDTSTYIAGFSHPPTDPTTTYGNHLLAIGPGLVIINNGSYSQTTLVNCNLPSPTLGVVTTQYPFTGGSQSLMMGGVFQTAPVNVTRQVQYSIHVNGVEVTA